MNDKAENAVSENSEDKKLRTVTGKVISSKMDKSVSVSVERLVKHPLYGKYLRRTTRYMAHDADNSCNEGDTVMIAECRPFSKNKSWRLVEVVGRAKA
jgi:small subunit ribosomal protein S17